jgi:prepilin-type N-terminal cleavage/methylation domain-containing protein
LERDVTKTLGWFTRRLDRAADDRGTTLLEIMVGMTIMGVFMSIFTTAVFTMSRTVNQVDAVTTTAGQVNQAFLKLDKLVRYASAISTEGRSPVSNKWYVELETTANGPDTCTQLRVDTTTKQLQQRTWTLTSAGTTAASAWRMLANGVTNGTAPSTDSNRPFSVPTGSVTVSSPFQLLTLTLIVTSEGVNPKTTKSRMTFTAVNSVASATTNASRCQQKGRP